MQAIGRFLIVEPQGANGAPSKIIVRTDAGNSPWLIGRIVSVGVDISAADAAIVRRGDAFEGFRELKPGDRIVYHRRGTVVLDDWAYVAVEHSSVISLLSDDDGKRAVLVRERKIEEGIIVPDRSPEPGSQSLAFSDGRPDGLVIADG